MGVSQIVNSQLPLLSVPNFDIGRTAGVIALLLYVDVIVGGGRGDLKDALLVLLARVRWV